MNNKNLAIVLILTITISSLSLLTVKPATAQSVTKPSIPEFTAKYVDHSYDIPPTYGTDQYTGKTIVTKDGEHIDNRTIEITIKNQLFTPFTDQNGNNINLLYNVQYKGSFGQEWSSVFGERSEWANSGTIDPYGTYGYPTQDSSSQYTTISYSLSWNMVEGQMDIQVEALKGYTTRAPDPAREHILWTVFIYTFYGEESGWSNTQTVTLGGASNSTSPNPTPSPTNLPIATNTQLSPTPTPTVPEFPSWIIPLLLTIMVASAGLLVYRKKHKPK